MLKPPRQSELQENCQMSRKLNLRFGRSTKEKFMSPTKFLFNEGKQEIRKIRNRKVARRTLRESYLETVSTTTITSESDNEPRLDR